MRFNIACPLNSDLSGRYRLKNRDLVEFTQSRTLLVNFLLSIKQQCCKIRQINRRSFFSYSGGWIRRRECLWVLQAKVQSGQHTWLILLSSVDEFCPNHISDLATWLRAQHWDHSPSAKEARVWFWPRAVYMWVGVNF